MSQDDPERFWDNSRNASSVAAFLLLAFTANRSNDWSTVPERCRADRFRSAGCDKPEPVLADRGYQ
jgi:hypothetical protein